ncbi:MAG: hypothetical protein Ct9H90mP16_11400 [Candidatus Poseidoniales archaeon]|nr:MAG: hypothetical protein Ct9H90mP16_11400 [Candidatus Poseidoniales archaeon]
MLYRGEIMAVQSYAFFAIIAALFGFGVYRILTAEQNPAQASRLGNVRSSAVKVPNLARIGLHWRMT